MPRILQTAMVVLSLGLGIAINSWRYPIVGQMAAQIPTWEFSLQPKQNDLGRTDSSQPSPLPLSTIQPPTKTKEKGAFPVPTEASPQKPALAANLPSSSEDSSTKQPLGSPTGSVPLSKNSQSSGGESNSSQASGGNNSPSAPLRTGPANSTGPLASSGTEVCSGMVSGQRLCTGLPLVPVTVGPPDASAPPGPTDLSSSSSVPPTGSKTEASPSQGGIGQNGSLPTAPASFSAGGSVQTNQTFSSTSPFPHQETGGTNLTPGATSEKTAQVSQGSPPSAVCTGSACFVGPPRPRIIQVRTCPSQEQPGTDNSLARDTPPSVSSPHTAATPSSVTEEMVEPLPPVDPSSGPVWGQARFPWPPGRVPLYPSTDVN